MKKLQKTSVASAMVNGGIIRIYVLRILLLKWKPIVCSGHYCVG